MAREVGVGFLIYIFNVKYHSKLGISLYCYFITHKEHPSVSLSVPESTHMHINTCEQPAGPSSHNHPVRNGTCPLKP